jgi:hypothetical protein
MTQGSPGFLRGNAFLIAAALLPLLVVIFFVFSSVIPRWMVEPPAYDLILRADGGYSQPGMRVTVEYSVRDGKVVATVRPAPPNTYPQPALLFLFDHTTTAVRQIPVDLPADMAANDPPRTIVVDVAPGNRVMPGTQAPDGYMFEARTQRGPGLFGELFGMNSYESSAMLRKNGRVVRIVIPVRYQYSPAFAVGWIVE